MDMLNRRRLFGAGIAGFASSAFWEIRDVDAKKGRKKRKKKNKKRNVQRENPQEPVCDLRICSGITLGVVDVEQCPKVHTRLNEQFVCRTDPADTRSNRDALNGDDLRAKRQVVCYVSNNLSGCIGSCCQLPDTSLEAFDTDLNCHPAWPCESAGSGTGNGADGVEP